MRILQKETLDRKLKTLGLLSIASLVGAKFIFQYERDKDLIVLAGIIGGIKINSGKVLGATLLISVPIRVLSRESGSIVCIIDHLYVAQKGHCDAYAKIDEDHYSPHDVIPGNLQLL